MSKDTIATAKQVIDLQIKALKKLKNSVNLSLEAYRLLYFEKNSGYIKSKLSRIKITNSSEQILSKLYEYK